MRKLERRAALCIVLALLFAIIVFALFAFFPDYFTELGQTLRENGQLFQFP